MNMGWTIVEVGWDLTAPQGGKAFGITLPVAKHHDGTSITGPALEELDLDLIVPPGSPPATPPTTLPLTYPAATADKSKASLTVRENYDDTPQLVSSDCWGYTDNIKLNAVELTTGNFGAAASPCGFGPTALYEFSYIAKDPQIVGLALLRSAISRHFCATPRPTTTTSPIRSPAM